MKIQRRSVLALGLAAPFAGVAVGGKAMAQSGPITVRMQGIGANASTLPETYARTVGLFEKNGLNVQFLPPIFNANSVMAVAVQGQADFAYTGGSAIVPVVQQGRPMKVVATILSGLDLKVSLTKVALEKLAKQGVTQNSSVEERVRALRGLRLGAPTVGSLTDLSFRYSMKKYGIDPKELTIQPMADMTALLAALRQGVVDGVVGTASTTSGRAETEGLAMRYLAFEESDPLLRAFPTYIIAVSDEYLQKNPEAVRRVLTVFSQAKAAIRRGLTDAEFAEVKKQFFPDTPQASYDYGHSVTVPALKASIVPKDEQLVSLLAINNAMAENPAKLTFAQVFDSRIAAEIEKP